MTTSVRSSLRGVIRSSRSPSAGRRALPAFLIVGAQKAGTSSLFGYLNDYPDVRSPLLKEVHYYDHNFHRGERWYRSNFPMRSDENMWLTGESSPYYLLHPGVPARVAAHLPDVKLVVLLRDPVRRAYSHFNHARSLGGEPLSDFEAALAAEPARTDDAWARLTRTGKREPAVEWFSYARRSQYAPQIRRWLEYFPRESLLIMTAEELYRDPLEAVRRTRTHLGLRPIVLTTTDFTPINARSYPPIPAGMADRMAASFTDDIREVETLMARKTGWTSCPSAERQPGQVNPD